MNKKNIKIQELLENSLTFFIKKFKRLFLPFISVYAFFIFIFIALIWLFNFDQSTVKLFLRSSNTAKMAVLYYFPVIIFLFFITPLLYAFESNIILNSIKPENYSFKKHLKDFFKKIYYIFPFIIFITIFELAGYTLLILPGLVLYSFLLFFPIEILKEKKIFRSIKNAIKAVKHNFFKTLLLVILLFFIQIILFSAVDYISNALFPVYTYTFLDNIEKFKNNIILFYILRFFLYSFIILYCIIVKIKFYNNITNIE